MELHYHGALLTYPHGLCQHLEAPARMRSTCRAQPARGPQCHSVALAYVPQRELSGSWTSSPRGGRGPASSGEQQPWAVQSFRHKKRSISCICAPGGLFSFAVVYRKTYLPEGHGLPLGLTLASGRRTLAER
ncbi:hypothetical protein H8959_016332 [Pygathrix nigripes]